MIKHLLNDERGFVISAELVIVLTLGVLAMIVGLSEVAVAVNTELCDISAAIGSLNQSFAVTGFNATDSGHKKSNTLGSAFNDANDVCDCTCNIVTCTSTLPTVGHTDG